MSTINTNLFRGIISSPCFAIAALLMVFSRTVLQSQSAPQSVDNNGIYEFLDELASGHIIAINQAVKPFNRDYIARKLEEADLRREELNRRQLGELDFYLADFQKEMGNGAGVKGKAEWVTLGAALRGERRFDMFYYSDSLFSITVNPIAEGEMFYTGDGNATYWRNGVDVRAIWAIGPSSPLCATIMKSLYWGKRATSRNEGGDTLKMAPTTARCREAFLIGGSGAILA